MTGSLTRGAHAVGLAILLLGLLAPALAHAAMGDQGTITPWHGVVGDQLSVEVADNRPDWSCPRPLIAEVGFHAAWEPWGDPPGYGALWAPAIADATGRRFRLKVPAIEPGGYDVYLRCDGAELLHIAAGGFGWSDARDKGFHVRPAVRAGQLAPVRISDCDDRIVNVWVTKDLNSDIRPNDRRLTPAQIVRRSVISAANSSVAWYRVPAVPPGEYFVFARTSRKSRCLWDSYTESYSSFGWANEIPVFEGFDPTPGLIVLGAPDSATVPPPKSGSTPWIAVAAGASLLGMLLSLRRTRPRTDR